MARSTIFFFIFIFSIFGLSQSLNGQITPVGNGSYTNTFPGVDVAGRNGFPAGSPQLSGAALGKPVPTNDWWSLVIKEDHVNNMFNYPMALRTINEGLVISYIVPVSTPNGASQPMGDANSIEVGIDGLNASRATVSDFTDWTVTLHWENGSNDLQATTGIAMPFIYFTKSSANLAEITVNEGSVTIDNEVLIITDSRQGSDYAVYAPAGSTWSQDGNLYSSDLNGKDYWSLAFLPETAASASEAAEDYRKFAYVFPQNTEVSWDFNAASSVVTSTFTVTPDIKEGVDDKVLMGLLPHQWANLSGSSAQPNGYSFSSIRGEVKTLEGNSFSVENSFKGILPTLPYLANYSGGFSPASLDEKISFIENDGLPTWTDSYNEGQMMNRMIQTARIADQMGDTEARDKMVATVRERLEDWLTAEGGEVAFIFYYNDNWSAMLGYPAGHGQDTNINDHHFHWGYFIHAAAFVEQFNPGWANDWGDMINLLVRDAASTDRNDNQFPFLRNFSPYAGHSWANGFATFPFGNDQESSSESMQFTASLIHWGTVTGNDEIRDLGIYLYTTEQTAAEEYWFDQQERTFMSGYGYSLASRIWGNGYDNQTFFTSDIAAAYGIEMYPIHGGSLYLSHNLDYVQKLWDEIAANTGIMSNQENPNLWHDMMWKYLSFIDPPAAIELYNSYPDRNLKFGTSDAQTYHWLHGMNALGRVKSDITADYPIAASFDNEGEITYVAHNYSNNPLTVTFSDGFMLEVPANQMATSQDINVSGVIASSFNQAFANGSVELLATVTGSGVTKVEFYDGDNLIGETSSEPYTMKAENLSLGTHGFYARVYQDELFNVTNITKVQVGEQLPYLGNPFDIPGTIEAGHYDLFEGGVGQDISYIDVSQINEGGFRPEEYVDAVDDAAEGATVGWITGGEWMEYSISVGQAGEYDMSFRYASGNPNGGGPFHFEIDGERISPDFSMNTTSDWGDWETLNVGSIELNEGEHILRLVVTEGEFNIGEMTFSFSQPLSYGPPVANAGQNIAVILPESTAQLDASLSTDPDDDPLVYSWEQVYGPSTAGFTDPTAVNPILSNLEEGVYKIKLTVSDGSYSSTSYVLVIVSLTGNTPPTVSITSPTNNASYQEGETIVIEASANDLDGSVSLVEFFDGVTKIGEDNSEPFSFNWTDASIGSHDLSAVATDNGGSSQTSQVVTVSVNEVLICSYSSDQAQQGSFSIGYKASFENVGSNLTVIFELLDTDKSGIVATLLRETPFSATPMDGIGGNKFSTTVGGLSPGQTIRYACQFQYAGGVSVTSYIDYVVGSECDEGDAEAPENFTAILGEISDRSIELIVNATDNSGTVIYSISYAGTTETISLASGVEETLLIAPLNPSTQYNFSITAGDLAGNISDNSPIQLTAMTDEDTNTECLGSSADSQQGSFDLGYTYEFVTNGSEVELRFELLDDRDGLIAFLWQPDPFTETQMNNVSGGLFSTTLNNQTEGETLSLACKFAFAGGLAVTKYFQYTVGNTCEVVTGLDPTIADLRVYPNPTKDLLNIEWKDFREMYLYDLTGRLILNSDNNQVDLKGIRSGVYLLTLNGNNQQYKTKLIIE